MSIIQRFGSVALAMGVALAVARSATAAEVTIDNFSQATNTAFIFGTQVEVDMTGQSKTVSDAGLTGTIGGVRQLTVTASSVTGSMSEQVVAGIDPIGPPIRLCYQATQMADGLVELVYDEGGSGLVPGDLHHAMGIEVDPIFADTASIPYSIKVTLVDSGNNSGSSVQTGNGNMGMLCSLDCPAMLFPFTDFPGVNPRQIRSITIQVDPSGGAGQAADFSLGPISTYGTPTVETICDDHEDNDNNGLTDCADPACARALNCIETAPLLSTGMISALIGMLGIVGFVGLGRAGWNK